MLGLLAAIAFAVVAAPNAAVSDTLCAFRAGPKGPCTCKTGADGVGQFSIVARSRCRPVKPKEAKQIAPLAADAAMKVAEAPASGALRDAPSAVEARKAAAPEGTRAIVTGALPSKGAMLDKVRSRGKLICGVNPGLLGFAHRTAAGDWAGLDADFCRAVAAATLGDPGKVEFVPLDASARFEALKSGAVDLLSRNTTLTMSRDVGLELEFAGVIFFDGQSFLVSEERGLVSAQQLVGTKICVQSGTTTAENLAYYLKAHTRKALPRATSCRKLTSRANAMPIRPIDHRCLRIVRDFQSR